MQPQQEEADVPSTIYNLARQNEQNTHNTGSTTSVRETPVVEISGITGYRLVGLLLAIAGLVKTALSVKELSAPVSKMDLVITGVFGIIYLCLGWAESSRRQFWSPFFRVDLSPAMIRGAVKFVHIFISSLHLCLYIDLVLWPICIPFIFMSGDFDFFWVLQLFGYMLVSYFIMVAQICACISIVTGLRRFPWSERFIDQIGRYVMSSFEGHGRRNPFRQLDDQSSVSDLVGSVLLMNLILIGQFVLWGILNRPPL